MNAIIKIVGTQTVDDEKDVIELTTSGTLEQSAEGWQLCYPSVHRKLFPTGGNYEQHAQSTGNPRGNQRSR